LLFLPQMLTHFQISDEHITACGVDVGTRGWATCVIEAPPMLRA
jgi:hypothetical protein